MIKRIIPALFLMFCAYLDIIFLPLLTYKGIRPDALLSFSVSAGVLMGPLAGAALGVAGGMLSDLLGGLALGLNSSMYLMCGIAGGFFYRKFYADNVIVPAATVAACAILKECFMAFIRFITGARFDFASAMLNYILPCALLSALFCIMIHLVLKRALLKQTKAMRREKIGMKD